MDNLDSKPTLPTGLTIEDLQESAKKLLEARKKSAQRPVAKIAILFGLIGAVPILISRFINRRRFLQTAQRFHQNTLHLDRAVVKQAYRAKARLHPIKLQREQPAF